MKKPKMFRKWTDRQYMSFIWFFVIPVSIYMVGRLIIWIVMIFF